MNGTLSLYEYRLSGGYTMMWSGTQTIMYATVFLLHSEAAGMQKLWAQVFVPICQRSSGDTWWYFHYLFIFILGSVEDLWKCSSIFIIS